LRIGISKRELMQDYYIDEINEIISKCIELEFGVADKTEQVSVDEFF